MSDSAIDVAPALTPALSQGEREPVLNPRTRMLLEAPIARTLVKLAVPNILVMGAAVALPRRLHGPWARGALPMPTLWSSMRC